MPNDRLVQLILSLNQSEKRYFKNYANKNALNEGPTKLSKFFDFLIKVKRYDADEVLRKCKYIRPNQLQNMRLRLYESILKSLRSYHSKSTGEIELYELLINYQVLMKKGLFEQCWKFLVKSEAIALKVENYSILEEVHLKQEHLLNVRLKGKNVVKDSQLLREKRNEIIDIKLLLDQIEKSEANCYQLFKKEGRLLRDTGLAVDILKDFKVLEKRMTSHLFSFKASYYISYNLSLIYRLNGEFKNALKYARKVEKLFSDPDLKERYKHLYHKFLNLYVILCNVVKDGDKANHLIAEMRNTTEADDRETELVIFENSVFQEIEVYLQQGKFERAVVIIEENLESIILNKDMLHTVNQRSKFYRIALAYFGNKNYKESLRWLNLIINEEEINYRKDILSSVVLLNLLVHFELHNYHLLANKINTGRRYLKKIGRLLQPEKDLLLALNQIISYQLSEKEAFSQFEEKLMNIYDKNPLDGYFLAYFDLLGWVNGKTKRA